MDTKNQRKCYLLQNPNITKQALQGNQMRTVHLKINKSPIVFDLGFGSLFLCTKFPSSLHNYPVSVSCSVLTYRIETVKLVVKLKVK